MDFVITIVSNPTKVSVDKALINGVVRRIEANGGKLLSQTTLSENEAIDLFFSNVDKATLDDVLGRQFLNLPIDYFCAELDPDIPRKKKMLVADMDSTILTVECIDEIADVLGIKDKVAAITEAAMRGELDFSSSLIERVALLKGLPAEKLDHVYKTRILLTEGAKTLVATMNANGASTHLLSGGFTYFSEKIAAELGFSQNVANVLEIENDILTGRVLPPIFDASSKQEHLIKAREAGGLNIADVLAVGDGANDIPMILEAGLGVAFMAKPKTAAKATAQINHTSLETLLFYQGYKRAEFAS